MRLKILHHATAAALCACLLLPAPGDAADDERANVETVVARTVRPLMEREGVPGMAVGVVLDGWSFVFEYGVASKATGKPVTGDTLFEVGSVSKTFTATLAAYAQVVGRLSLTDPASKHFPELRGSHFDEVTLLHLGTHTPGGLPLQVPDEVTNDEQLIRYFRDWKPSYPPGTWRTYGNPGIGLLGRAAARSLGGDFVTLMEGKLAPALGLKHTHWNVPDARTSDYAQGYTEEDKPVRIAPGILDAEAGGVVMTAGDLLRFIEVNLGLSPPADPQWQSAAVLTHTGYYQIGGMTQDLVWEQYPYPVALPTLLAGSSTDIILKPNPAVRLDPPSPPREDVWINKTGSTNGFSTYVAFVPARKIGVVLLANKRFPISARVTAVHEILTRLTERAPTR